MSKGVVFQNIDELYRFAEIVFKGGIRKGSIKNAEQAACVIQHGAEVGLGPMMAIKVITIKGDIPTIDGDGMLALVRASGFEEWTKSGFTGEGVNIMGWCETKRKGLDMVRREFTHKDAVKADLLNKGFKMYDKFPQRMYVYRAMGFVLRDVYPDVLGGLHMTEEIEDETLPPPTCETPSRENRREENTETPVQPEAPKVEAPKVKEGDAILSRDEFNQITTYFCKVAGMDPKDEETKKLFIATCADVLACSLADVDSPSKFTKAMKDKVMAYIAEIEKKQGA